MSFHRQCRNYYALANIGLVRLLHNPLPMLPKILLKSEKSAPVGTNRPASDTFDIFVDELINTKSEQWKFKSAERSKKLPSMLNNYGKLAVDKNEVTKKCDAICNKNDLFRAAEIGDLDTVIKMLHSASCSEISLLELKSLAQTFEETDSLQGIAMIEKVAAEKFNMESKPKFYEHQIKCFKRRGENIKALNVCEELYKNYPDLRREIRGYLSNVLIDIVGHHSEAALVQGKDLVERISIDYKDFRPISSLWHACFLSEWFSDQQVATQLLTHTAKQQHMQILERRMLAATYTALAQHRPELVHGLLQDLLSCKLHSHVTPVLRALFDYKCSMEDLKGCSAIIRTSLDINISLTAQQHTRLLDLLCQRKKSRWLHGREERSEPPTKPESPPPFQLKF